MRFRNIVGLALLLFAAPVLAKPTLGLRYPNLTPDGKKVVFCYRGDIWVAHVDGSHVDRLTIHEQQETLPRISPDGKTVAFTSKRNGGHDIFTVPIAGGVPKQITFHSAFEAMCDWSPDGKKILFVSNRDMDSGRTDLYEMDVKGGTPRRITYDGASEGSYSADGKQIVYVRGFIGIYWDNYEGAANHDIYTIPTSGGTPVQLTKTPGNERFPYFSEDGKFIFFLGEEKGVVNFYAMPTTPNATRKQITSYKGDDVHRPKLAWDRKTAAFERRGQVYLRDLTKKDAKTRALKLEVKSDVRHSGVVQRTITTGGEQIHISADGRRAAFVLRGDIWTMSASGGNARRLTSGPAKDQWPRWSPDGNTIAYFSNSRGNDDIYLLDVRSGKSVPLTRNPRGDFFHNWSPDGKHLVFCSERSGNKDIWIVEIENRIFTQLTREPQADDDPTFTPDGKSIVFDSGRNGPQAIYIMARDGSNQRRISSGTAFYQVPSVSPDGRMIVYEAMSPVTGRSMGLFVSSINGGPSSQFSPDGSSACWTSNGYIYFHATRGGGRRMRGTPGLYRLKAPTSVVTGERISFVGRVEVDQRKELGELFDEAWLALRDGFYDKKMHGVDWNKMKSKYRPMAVDAENKDEWANIIRQMLGELGASHLGVYPNGGHGSGVTPTVVNTGVLGLDFEQAPTKEGGRRVAKVVPGGPADKAGIRVGDVVTRVGSRKLKTDTNLDRALNGTVGKEITLGYQPLSASGLGSERSQKVSPISLMQLRSLKQSQWVKSCAELVKEKTKTKKSEVAYIHLSMMNQQNLAKFQSAVAGWMRNKKIKGMILDVRGNGGGNIHNQLMQILTTKPLAEVQRRGQPRTTQPIPVYWDKPTVVLINERSFSDAEVFPYMFQAAKRGKVIGVPTAGGVIGTNDVQLSDGTTFRIPRVGFWGMDGTNLEGLGVKPDILVEETPEDRLSGKDRQLLVAIDVIQKEIASLPKPVEKKEETKKPAPKPEAKPEPKPAPKPVSPAAASPEKGDPMNPLADVVAGEWIRYRVDLPGTAGPSVVKVTVSEVTDEKVKFRQELEDGSVLPPLPTSLKRRDVLTILPLFGQVIGHKVADGSVEAIRTRFVHADVRWPDGSQLSMAFTNAVPCYGLYKVTMGGKTIIEATEWGIPKAPEAKPVPKPDVAKPKEEAKPAAKTTEEPKAEDGGDKDMPLHPLYDAKEGEWVRVRTKVRGGRLMEMTTRVEEVDLEENEITLVRTLHVPERDDLKLPPRTEKRRKHMRKMGGRGFTDIKVGESGVSLTVADKELKCFTITGTSRQGNEMTWYYCPDIPVDGLVRVERDGDMIMELLDWGTEDE
ncbi:MAG: S41 family peptidase [Planctomycetota bacterium]